VTGLVRVTNARLKVVLFSLSSGWPVRAAGKRITNRIVCRLQGSKVEMSKGKRAQELNGEALSSQEEEPREEECDWLDCDENMGQGSISLAGR